MLTVRVWNRKEILGAVWTRNRNSFNTAVINIANSNHKVKFRKGKKPLETDIDPALCKQFQNQQAAKVLLTT
jgi:hypothetical protein